MSIQPSARTTSLSALSLLLLSNVPIIAASLQYPLCSHDIFNSRFAETSCGNLPQGGFANDQARNACICSDDGFISDFFKTVFAQCACEITQQTADIFYRNCNGTSTDVVSTTPDKSVDQIMIDATHKPNCTASDSTEEKGHGGLSTDEIIAIVVPVVMGTPLAAAACLQILIWLGIVKEKHAWAWIKRRILRRGGQDPARAPAPEDEQPIREAEQV